MDGYCRPQSILCKYLALITFRSYPELVQYMPLDF